MRSLGWVAVALAAGFVILVAWNFQTGVCVDSADPAASGCTIGPAVGVPGAWVLTVAAAAVIVYAVWRIVGAFAPPGLRRAK